MEKELTLDEKVEAFNKEVEPLLEKYNLVLSSEIQFPQYAILPEEIQLAIIVLNNHKPKKVVTVIEKPNAN